MKASPPKKVPLIFGNHICECPLQLCKYEPESTLLKGAIVRAIRGSKRPQNHIDNYADSLLRPRASEDRLPVPSGCAADAFGRHLAGSLLGCLVMEFQLRFRV